MSYYEPEVQPLEESPQFRDAVAAARREERAAVLAEHNIKVRPPEEEIQAELIAAGSTEEIRAVLRKYDMDASE